LQSALDIFKVQKDKIYSLIKTFEPLKSKEKDYMIRYLDGFYEQIKDQRNVKYLFIDGARRQ
jgi:hypothetical protein